MSSHSKSTDNLASLGATLLVLKIYIPWLPTVINYTWAKFSRPICYGFLVVISTLKPVPFIRLTLLTLPGILSAGGIFFQCNMLKVLLKWSKTIQ